MGLAANSQQAGRLDSKSVQASVALLVFLAAAAWARIVTAHAWHFTLGCFIQTGIFTAQGSVVIRMMETNIGVGGCFNSRFLNLLRCLNAHGHQHFDHFIAHTVQHVGEQLESFALVFLFGIFLGVTTQMNTLTQVIQSLHSRYDRTVVEQAAIAGVLNPKVTGDPATARFNGTIPSAATAEKPRTPATTVPTSTWSIRPGPLRASMMK